jgi:hypothetical protein
MVQIRRQNVHNKIPVDVAYVGIVLLNIKRSQFTIVRFRSNYQFFLLVFRNNLLPERCTNSTMLQGIDYGEDFFSPSLNLCFVIKALELSKF